MKKVFVLSLEYVYIIAFFTYFGNIKFCYIFT